MRSGIPSSVNIRVAEKRRMDFSHGSESPAHCQRHMMTSAARLKSTCKEVHQQTLVRNQDVCRGNNVVEIQEKVTDYIWWWTVKR